MGTGAQWGWGCNGMWTFWSCSLPPAPGQHVRRSYEVLRGGLVCFGAFGGVLGCGREPRVSGGCGVRCLGVLWCLGVGGIGV